MKPLCRRRKALLAAAILLLSVLSGAAVNPAQAAPAGTVHEPDLQTIVPTNSFSIVQTPGGPEFRYTHLVYNAGSGPLEIQPEYNQASGTYLGMQQVFTHDAAGSWSMVSTKRVADAFEFHAEHGHFHFPFAAFGLYAVAPNGDPGAPVALAPKLGFCIADSYIYNGTITHAGTFVGSQGSCADPNTLRGLSVGGADEYDYRDPGQAVPIGGVPDGTYWFRALSDPNDDFIEADEANNETDVKVTIANGRVVAGEVRHPDTTPPAVTLGAPLGGAILSDSVAFSATTPVTGAGAVQFLVDGVVVGTSTDAASPFTFAWDSTTVLDGVHWIAARARDAAGRVGTSAIAAVIVDNSSVTPPSGVLAIDAIASQDGSNTIQVAGLTTSVAGDRLIALIASDGPASAGQQVTVSGAGLTWSLVRRANTSFGTSEVWSAQAPNILTNAQVSSTQRFAGFSQSMTVVAFSGSGGIGASSGSGAASGAPTTSLITVADGSLVFGVGNDWDGAVPRTLGPNQVMRHQWVNSGIGTFWMQSQLNPIPAAGTAVTTNATSPTTDQWNLASVEIIAAEPAPPQPDTQAPQVTVTDPHGAAILSGITTFGATAADNVGVISLQFEVDGQPVGPLLTSPPFATLWDTRSATPGLHTVTAEARDAAGNIGSSAPVGVTVDNSAPPPAVITIDAMVNARGSGTLVSPGLTTTKPDDVLIAFVSYDGPSSPGSQSSTVTGGGLTWTLEKRSNTQAGDSEIWSAKASGTLSGAVVTATPLANGYAGMLTVIAFANAAGTGVAGASGAPSGAPDIYLPGVEPGSWVFAAGNDWDGAVGRTPVAGQVLHQQWIDTQAGDTFWVQSTGAPAVTLSLVTIHDDAPTNHRWNYVAVEVRAAALAPPPTLCNNGLDDDVDGLADLADPGCANALDDSEKSPALVCDDGIDNDGDLAIDFPADAGCSSLLDATETSVETLDSDGDLVPDSLDNCKYRANADQADTNNDGIGNRCTCGDMDGSGTISSADGTILRNYLAGATPPATFSVDKCNVQTSNTTCSSADGTILRNFLAGSTTTGINFLNCPAYTGP